MRYVWVFPILGALWGATYLFAAMFNAESGPQQAAGAAVAAALAIIPYVVARAVDGIGRVGDRESLDRGEGR